jgi:tRNA pseudouridine55 synthase
MGFDKEYTAEFILGFSSDSNDVLGSAENEKIDNEIDEKELKKKIKGFVGKYEQKIPKYSSYKIKGKPMFHYARKGIKIEDVKKNVIIKKVKVNSIYQIGNSRLLKYIVSKINKVKGDFRQEDIVNNWNKLLKEDKRYYVLNVTLSVSSGTYIRAIADDFGSEYGGGLLLSLKRTKVGKFDIKKSLKIR